MLLGCLLSSTLFVREHIQGKPLRTTSNGFRTQLQSLGFSYDWDREVDTTDPDYYRWTQWIFLKLFNEGLAYEAEVPVWWCEELGTTLANEEVIEGKSEVGGHPCERRNLRQWMLKITHYAERLLEGLDKTDWPTSTKEMQRNWIGRSEGAEINFPLADGTDNIRVFTTRPDTIFGATYMVLAPEHPLVDQLTIPSQHASVEAYRSQALRKSDLERTELQKEKTGVFTGGYAVNPANDERIPVWVADYVLATYGTGAIMAVPGQDERDWEFAEAFELPIVRTVQPPASFTGKAYIGDGPAINSGFLNSLNVEKAKAAARDWLESSGNGTRKVNYKLRDWLFSRQRYWGEPIPVLYVDGTVHPLSHEDLPLTLPELEEFKPSGSLEGPLALAHDWLSVQDPKTGKLARRETNTMPQWAGSCWYFLRYIDPDNMKALVDPEKERYWMPVDLYVGGAEHAVLHLLYARFWHMVLYDAGMVSTPEPFAKLVHQGMILGELEYTAYREKKTGDLVSASKKDGAFVEPERINEEDVRKEGDHFVLKKHPHIRLDVRAHKMSKSRGNVVNPDDVVGKYGADAFRLYEMFMGPLEQVKPWSTRGVSGTFKFLRRTWIILGGNNNKVSDQEPSREQRRMLHLTLKRVTKDIEALRMNTAIAALMEFVNAAYKWSTVPRKVAEPFVLMLSPFAPHLGEELWEKLGHRSSLAYAPWPQLEEKWLKEDQVSIPVQVNGRVRATLKVSPTISRSDVLKLARLEPNVQRFLEGKQERKAIYVPKRIINLVVK